MSQTNFLIFTKIIIFYIFVLRKGVIMSKKYTTISIEIDDKLKQQAEELFASLDKIVLNLV